MTAVASSNPSLDLSASMIFPESRSFFPRPGRDGSHVHLLCKPLPGCLAPSQLCLALGQVSSSTESHVWPLGTPAVPVFAHNNICVGFAFDQQKNTSSLSPLHSELTLPQERQKVKLVDKVRKARCLLLCITTANSTGTLQIPCDTSNPTCYRYSSLLLSISSNSLTLTQNRASCALWGKQGACWRCQSTQQD